MRVLGIDTSTLTAAIAVVESDGDRVLGAQTHDTSERRSTDLLVGIDAMCTSLGVAPTTLDAIAVGAGPGSFTGLRIGMATAKGIAFAAQRPLWAVSSLAALAFDAGTVRGSHEVAAGVCAVLDARRGEVFAGCYRDGALVGEERVMAPAELAAWVESLLGADAKFAGNALDAYRDVLAPLADRWLPVSTPSGIAVARLALAGPRVNVLTSGAPMYIRASEAEIKYPDGVPGAFRKR